MKIIIFEPRTFLVFFNTLNRLETTLCLYLYLKQDAFIVNGHHFFRTWRPYESMKQNILSFHI